MLLKSYANLLSQILDWFHLSSELIMNIQKVSVITGASKGIGFATAQRLDRMGHLVIGLARNKPEHSFPGEFIEVDLSDRDATEEVATNIASRYQITHLINNVGLVRSERIGEVDLDGLDAVLDLNLRPAVQLTQAFLPAMKSQGFGRIVNISSLVVLGLPLRTSYSAAKAGLIAMTRTWATELAPTRITVNAVAPGPTETELFRANNPPGSEGEKRYLASIPMNRLGKPEEIAAAITFLSSDNASFITGQTLFVDGGGSLGRQAI